MKFFLKKLEDNNRNWSGNVRMNPSNKLPRSDRWMNAGTEASLAKACQSGRREAEPKHLHIAHSASLHETKQMPMTSPPRGHRALRHSGPNG